MDAVKEKLLDKCSEIAEKLRPSLSQVMTNKHMLATFVEWLCSCFNYSDEEMRPANADTKTAACLEMTLERLLHFLGGDFGMLCMNG